MTTVVQERAADLHGVASALDSDTLTLAEHRALAGNGSPEAAQEFALAAEHRRAAVAEGSRFRNGLQDRPDAATGGRSRASSAQCVAQGPSAATVAGSQACEWCHEPFTPRPFLGGLPQRFCGAKCRDRAAGARKRARAAGVEVPSAAVATAVETPAAGDGAAAVTGGTAGAAVDPSPVASPSPATDGLIDVVGALLALDTVGDITLERGDWRLVAHRRA